MNDKNIAVVKNDIKNFVPQKKNMSVLFCQFVLNTVFFRP